MVLYDAGCGFCRWSLALLLLWDRRGRLAPVPIESPEGNRLLAGLGPEERLASWHLVLPGGRRLSAGAAAGPLLRALPGGRAPARVAERFPAATEAAYGWVARRRGLLGRAVPSFAQRRADERIRRRQASRGGPAGGRGSRAPRP